MKRTFSVTLKTALLCFILVGLANCFAQTTLKGTMVSLVDSLNPISWGIIAVNKSDEYFPDSAGSFTISFPKRGVYHIEFMAMGFHSLALEMRMHGDSMIIDTVALSMIDLDDDYFITVNEKGKRVLRADRIRKKRNRLEVKIQASLAYIVYQKKKIMARDGFVHIK